MRNCQSANSISIAIVSKTVQLLPERGLLKGEISPTRVTVGKEHPLSFWDASHATDGDLYTAAAAPTTEEPNWIKIEFDKTYSIHKVIIYHRFYTNWYDPINYWCAQNLDDFVACVDGSKDVDVSVYQGDIKQKSCGTLQLTHGPEQSDQIYTLICNTIGDTLTLSKNTPDYIVVCEVAVVQQGTSNVS